MSSFECSKWILRSMSSLEKLFTSEMPIVRFNSTLFVGYDALEADKLFLARAVTSFLQTHSYATIIGSDEKSVNKFISTLALFLSDSQRACASYCDRYRNQYVPDLHVQGLILQGDIRKCVSTSTMKVEVNRSANIRRSSTSTASDDTDMDSNLICDELIIQSRYPSTLIDIRDRSVWQTRLYPEYRQLRADFLDANISSSTSLASLYKKSPSTDRMRAEDTAPAKAGPAESTPVYQQDELFLDVPHPSPWVLSLCERLFVIDPELRPAYITTFLRLLLRYVVFMIHYLEELLVEGGYKDSPILNNRDRYRIKEKLDVMSDSDWAILLSVAESYRPGTYVTLRGDPMMIEKKFLELFEDI